MNESRRGRIRDFWKPRLHLGAVDLEEIGTDVAETRTVRQAIEHPGAVAKLYE